MNNFTWIFTLIGVSFYFLPIAFGVRGTASFYNPPYTPSACYGNKDWGVMVAAAGRILWRNRSICGVTYKVSCTGAANLAPYPCKDASAYVLIVDHCPKCSAAINLSRDAFHFIANLTAGRIKIDYIAVDKDIPRGQLEKSSKGGEILTSGSVSRSTTSLSFSNSQQRMNSSSFFTPLSPLAEAMAIAKAPIPN